MTSQPDHSIQILLSKKGRSKRLLSFLLIVSLSFFSSNLLANNQVPSKLANIDEVQNACGVESFNCHLMMNPAVEETENAIKKFFIKETKPPLESNPLETVQTARGREHSTVFSLDSNAIGSASIECTPTNLQSSSDCDRSSNPFLPSSAAVAVSPTSHLLPPTTIRPAGRIVTPSSSDQLAQSSETEKLAKVAREKKTTARSEEEADIWDDMASFYEEASASWLKSFEAFNQGNPSMEMLWRKTAKQNQEAANYLTQAAKLAINYNTDEQARFADIYEAASYSGHSVYHLNAACKALEKATQATTVNQEEIAALWNKAVEQNQEAANYYTQVAKAKVSDNAIERARFDNFKQSALSAREGTYLLKKAVEALEKVSQVTEIDQEELYHKIATQSEEAAEYYAQAAKTLSSDNSTERLRGYAFEKAASSAKCSVYRLENVSEALEKATQLTKENQEEIAALWIKAAEANQATADYYTQAAKAIVSNKPSEKARFNNLYNTASSAAENASELWNQAEIALWDQA
ncbi:MAG TPA: hypothetical protein VJK54_06935 [Chthoniobacterales bacterium]|nr:hypothetical protein [Chthoniobacterales bacterium]